MSMRGIDTQVRKNRRRIFKEVASLAYESRNLKDDVEALPYKIVDYDESEFTGKGPLSERASVWQWVFPCVLRISRCM